MTKSKLIEEMETARAEWEKVLDLVGEAQMTLAVLHGNWTVKDTIGHVAYYERWLQSWLEAAARGQVTVASHRDVLDVDQRNALIWVENKDRTLKEILEESRVVFDRLVQLVKILPEADLLDPYVVARYVTPFWGKAQPLWQCIAGDSYEHYREHTENIQRWLEQVTVPQVASAMT
ncbi:MAG: ClbS/DfsB family four-helix bundle protein [Chloroflexi bacterium]|nr:ClbS/DfsB family four-helix bundle protein [Chloroflexota bacterium]